jgi:Family of unknown function (DUF6459)
MPIEQTLTPSDLSAMQLLTVPDVWPPIDCPPTAGLAHQKQAPFADPGDSADPADPEDRGGSGSRGEPSDGGQAWPRQFAVLLAEALTGDRPERQIMPWLSQRGSVHLHRLLPLFCGGQGARVQRVMTTQPTPDVIEMTLIVAVGPRIRALAVRLALAAPDRQPGWREKLPARTAEPRSPMSPRWLCTDIEAA